VYPLNERLMATLVDERQAEIRREFRGYREAQRAHGPSAVAMYSYIVCVSRMWLRTHVLRATAPLLTVEDVAARDEPCLCA
jgi:hypothetical protein